LIWRLRWERALVIFWTGWFDLTRERDMQHYRMEGRERTRIEFWRGDDRWRPSLHVHWNWNGGHWLLIFLPEIGFNFRKGERR
jgi:hypothetical protein